MSMPFPKLCKDAQLQAVVIITVAAWYKAFA
jgi:hypothetical protein